MPTPEHRSVETVRRHLPVLAVVASFIAYVVVRALTHASSFDLDVYRAEGNAIRHGRDLYGLIGSPQQAKATYPPFSALLFVTLTTVPRAVLHTAVLVLNLALVLLAAWLSCRLVGHDRARSIRYACGFAALAVWAEPVLTTLRYGQINLLLLVLVLWDLTRGPDARTRGVGIGIAAGLKVTPAIFVIYLLITGRVRAAMTALATLAATVAVSVLVVPGATWHYWTSAVFDGDRVGSAEGVANQSLRGLFARLDHTRAIATGELLSIGVVFVAGLWCAAIAYRRLGEAWGACACAVTALLCAPMAWSHHWVWCLPIAVLLRAQARAWLPVAAVFVSYLVWLLPHHDAVELRYARWQTALSSPYVLAGLAFLGITARMSSRRTTSEAAIAEPATFAPLR